MKNRLLQFVCLLAFAAIALPGHAGLHWVLGLEHHLGLPTSTEVSKVGGAVHNHAHCKHHHHHPAGQSVPRDRSLPSDEHCSICDFYSQPMSDAVAPFELSVALFPLAVSVVDGAVRAVDPLVTPPARGPPSLA